MKELDKPFKRIVIAIYIRKQLYLFLFSMSTLMVILFNIISGISLLEPFFQIISLLGTLFIVLFLPSYPLFFIIYKDKNFNFLEKLSLTIVSNLVFYILTGYMASIIGIPITGIFYFTTIIISYLLLISIVILYEKMTNSPLFLKPTKRSLNENLFLEQTSLKRYVKKLMPINGLLTIFFLSLMAFLHGVRFSYFFGTDAMYHIFMIRLITNLNFLPVNQYFGAMGLHLFGAVINLFSGVDLILLAKYFSFYTFFISGLIFYNILMRIFRNRNLALFGVFLLEITSLGFSNMMYQYWPTNLATIQCLLIFFLLYTRLENFIKINKPTKEKILTDLLFTYMFIILLTISTILTHSLISTIYLVSFFIILFIYFVRDYKRGMDIIITTTSLVIFLLLFNVSSINQHWSLVDIIHLPWYIFLFGGIAVGFIVWRLRKTIHFTPGRFTLITSGKKYPYYKKFEDKVILPLFLIILIFFSIGFVIINILFLNIHFSKVFVAIECFYVGFYSIWGLFLFQTKPRGNIILFWLLGMCAIFIGALAIDIFVLNEFWSGRITLLMSPILIIGFVAYIYKTIKIHSIDSYKVKIIIFTAIVLTLISHFSDQILDNDSVEYSLYKREVYGVIWYSDHISDENFVICEFGWPYILDYYGYPYEEYNQSILALDLFPFIQAPKGYFKPSDHFYDNGTNKLQYMKNSLNMDIYLILDDNYLALTGWEIFERLTPAEMDAYYNLDYLNKVYSSKSEKGVEVPYYWVI